jgi:uncharacterized protein
MKLAASVTAALLAAASVLVAAQSSAPTWAGEWGAFSAIPPSAADKYQGRSLSITDCTGPQCKTSLLVETQSGDHCEAAGNLQIKSASEAVIHLTDLDEEKCSLTFERKNTGAPGITVKSNTGDCSYYCTPGAAFTGNYPLHSTSRFFGDSIDACYAPAGPSQSALCTSQTLSSLHIQWRKLVWEVSDLGKPPLDQFAEQKKILAQCDTAAQPSTCLTNAFHQSMQQLDERKAEWHTKVTEAGNPQEAQQKIAAIAGHYRHSFKNGDVEGDTYTSTDTLRITKNSDDSIRYALALSFYNGHECNRSGVAHYKAGGMFVDQTLDDTTEKACFFEIIPTAKGVQLGDPTGACRETDCGARGGYINESFSFNQRVNSRPPDPAKSRQAPLPVEKQTSTTK